MLAIVSAPTLDACQLEQLAGLQDEGADLLPELVDLFVADTDVLLAEATRAVSGANVSALQRIAHNLSGTCGTIGAARMRALAAELETTLSLGQVQPAGSLVQMLVEEFGHVGDLLGEYVRARGECAGC